MDFATKTIHAGQPSEPQTGAVVSPIFQTTTYQQIGPGEHRGFDYTRTNNPTRERLEGVLAELEGGTAGRGVRIGPRGRARDPSGVSETGPGDRRARRRLRRHLPDAAQGLRAHRLRDQAGGLCGSRCRRAPPFRRRRAWSGWSRRRIPACSCMTSPRSAGARMRPARWSWWTTRLRRRSSSGPSSSARTSSSTA